MRFLCFTAAIMLCSAGNAAESWMQFRGPNGSGVSNDSASVPTDWSKTQNLAWKTALPGPGASSPITVGQRVFVTCYSGYGTPDDTKRDISKLTRHLCCYELNTGALLWHQDIEATIPEDSYYESGVSSHGYASHTPVSDGENVYVFFGKSGVFAFDLEGQRLWSKNVGNGSDPPKWGSASSPIIYRDVLVITAAAESQSIIGLDKATGKVLWKHESSSLDGMWGTPAILDVSEDRDDLVMMIAGELWGFNPITGERLWYRTGIGSKQAYTSVLCRNSEVFASSGTGGGTLCVNVDQQANQTEPPELVWQSPINATYATPVMYRNAIYLISRNILSVLDAGTGERLKQIRLRGAKETGGPFGSLDYASPVCHEGLLYYLNARGQVYVFDLDNDVKQLAVNEITNSKAGEKEIFWGTPAITKGRLILRSNQYLYCIQDAR